MIGWRKKKVGAQRATTHGDGIAKPGVNCWRIEHAERFRCVQDGEEYFALVRTALLSARRTVFILGWDIYAGVDLAPRGVDDGAPTKLAELLDFIARRTPELQVYVLIWDYAALYMLERDPTSRIRLGWATHERVRFEYDDLHPTLASHHQKVIVVDDRLAFSGGLDLTSHRWDTCAHTVDDPLRLTVMGEPYIPFHDVQALVEGPAATALGELCRERWARIGEPALPAVSPGASTLWPEGVSADIEDARIVIARTEPAFRLRRSVRECERLFYDEIAAARHSIYIENQYFTNLELAEALGKRLREPDGPEIVFVGPRECSGWLEKKTMGALRQTVLRHLVEADVHKRLRLLQPVASKEKDVCTFVHSKILIIDDLHLRIGSANLSNRSMGMDTECDLVALGDTPQAVAGIRKVRARLIAEHLGLSAEEVAAGIERQGSLRAAIDALASGDKTLDPITVDESCQSEPWEPMRSTVDPDGPMELSRAIDRIMPLLHWDDWRKSLRMLVITLGLTLGFLVLGRTLFGDGITHRDLREILSAAAAADGLSLRVFLVVLGGGLLFIPFQVLVFVAVVWAGPIRGGLLALAATALCAVIGYLAGRALGAGFIERHFGRRMRHLTHALHGRGALSVALVRVVALFSTTSLHVLCGAAKVPPRAYAAGTLIGLAPTWISCLIVGALLRQSLLNPNSLVVSLTVLAAGGLALMGFRLRRVLLMRQQNTASRADRGQVEHG